MQKVVRQFEINILKLGSFNLLGWLATFFYGGIQAQSYIKLLGWLAYLVLIIIILGKQSQEFPKKLGKLVIHYFSTQVASNLRYVQLPWQNKQILNMRIVHSARVNWHLGQHSCFNNPFPNMKYRKIVGVMCGCHLGPHVGLQFVWTCWHRWHVTTCILERLDVFVHILAHPLLERKLSPWD